MNKHATKIILVATILIGGLFVYNGQKHQTTSVNQGIAEASIVKPKVLKYGLDVQDVVFQDFKIKPNAFMGDILMSFGVDFDKILALEREAEDVFSLRKIRSGKNITFIKDDECADPSGFIYKPSLLQFVKFDFGGEVCVSKHEVPYEVCVESASGVVNSSLWNAMMDQGFDVALVDKMEDAIAQVNFHAAQPGDQFKLVYERIYVEGKPTSTGKILSAAYKSGEYLRYGFYYENDKYKGYYDQNGSPNKKTFLNAPLRYSRISSAFNRNRFHPVLKRRKAHLGTDYAAATGTAIMAVADGVVTHRSYTKGNGNYVKIKHDKTYQTQYLHMSRFARNVKRGTRVKQGQTIGYVGSTGLATGPHVCFRFWKNGRQVDHRRENFPPLNPMDDSELPEFFAETTELIDELQAVPFADRKVVFAGNNAD